MTTRFFIEDVFTVQSRSIFVLSGNIIDGVIQTGMKILVPLNRHTSIDMVIDSVEFIDPGGKVGLCVRYSNEEELGLLEALNIGEEEVEVIR